MPTYGYPDWSRQSSGISAPIIADLLFPPTGAKDYGDQYVGNFPNILIEVFNQDLVAYNQLILNWDLTTAGGTLAGTTQMFIGPNQQAYVNMPVKAPYVDVKLGANVTQSGSQTVFQMMGTTSSLTPGPAGTPGAQIFNHLDAYSANQNINLSQLEWYQGDVVVSAISDAGNPAYVDFQWFNPNTSVWMDFHKVGVVKQQNSVPVVITLPGAPVRASVNNGATGQNIQVLASPKAFW